jgi:hypothetical protein
MRLAGELRHNQLRASEALKQIRDGENKYRSKNSKYASLKALATSHLLPEAIANQVYEGYRITLFSSDHTYKAIAIPVEHKVTGALSFYLDESGVIRVSSDATREPNASDPAIVDQ